MLSGAGKTPGHGIDRPVTTARPLPKAPCTLVGIYVLRLPVASYVPLTFSRVLTAVGESLRRHPRRITGSLAMLLLGTGVTAFGVAPLAPDAADLPVRQVLESIQPLAPASAQAQTEALAGFSFKLFRTEATRSSDTAGSLLKRLNLDDAAADAFLRSDANAQLILQGHPGKNVTVEASEQQQLLKLSMRWATDDEQLFQRLVIERSSTGFTSRIETAPYTRSARLASAAIQYTLFGAIDDAGIPDGVGVQIAEIFATDIDFRRSLRKGDRFNVVYETLEADGETIRSGRVLSAEFVNNGKTFQAMWFQPPGKDAAGTPFNGGYYTLDGQSMRRSFLSSPVEFSRISSGFSMRFHPILQTWRAHKGTDFAASTGTPARTIGDGVVEFAGVQNGFGNVVFVKHRNNMETVYAHLSKINVQAGQSVTQGQTIGLVGSTGWATGPHLHFEVRVDGVQKDPMTIARESDVVPVTPALLPQFKQLANGFRNQLQAAATIDVSRIE